MKAVFSVIGVVAASVLVVLVIFFASLLPAGLRLTSDIENISGVPYPQANNQTEILERLAHADVYLNQPVLGKELHLTVNFIPRNLRKLAVGVRENSFWLSYDPVTIYESEAGDNQTAIQREVTIPLTDKLQEKDQSLDLMFIATSDGQFEQNLPGNATTDSTRWELLSLQTSAVNQMPTKAQFMDYIRSVIKRERAL